MPTSFAIASEVAGQHFAPVLSFNESVSDIGVAAVAVDGYQLGKLLGAGAAVEAARFKFNDRWRTIPAEFMLKLSKSVRAASDAMKLCAASRRMQQQADRIRNSLNSKEIQRGRLGKPGEQAIWDFELDPVEPERTPSPPRVMPDMDTPEKPRKVRFVDHNPGQVSARRCTSRHLAQHQYGARLAKRA